MKQHILKHKGLWALLGSYGVWFAIISGLEEISTGKYWKSILSLALGLLSLFTVRDFLKPSK